MAVSNLSELYVSESFQRLLQVSSSQLLNGTGSLVTLIHVSGTVSASAFVGDGSGLTGVTGEWDGTRNGDSRITGSFYVSGSEMIISGSFKVSGSYVINNVKTYKALLSQAGTSDPTAIILGHNSLGNIIWTRSATGSYVGTLTGQLTDNKMFFDTPTLTQTTTYIYIASGQDNNRILVDTVDISSSQNVDAQLFNQPILIEVYP